jgi:DNA polymerase III subunit epsilon
MTTAVVTDGGADLREYVQEWALVDIEASGLRPSEHRVLSLAVITLGPDGRQVAEYSTLVDPGPDCDLGPVHIHGLTAERLRGAPDFASIARRVAELLRSRVMVAHNALFDYGFLSEEFARAGVELPVAQRLCTLALNRRIGPPTTDLKLGTLAAYYGVRQRREHDALDDTRVLMGILQGSLAAAARLELRLPLVACPPRRGADSAGDSARSQFGVRSCDSKNCVISVRRASPISSGIRPVTISRS